MFAGGSGRHGGLGRRDTLKTRGAGVVTFDVWHTLIDLPPFAESNYMRRQWSIGGDSVAEAGPGPLAADRTTPMDPWAAFRQAYEEAVAAARDGSTISPVAQLRRAGALAGRRPREETYEARLERLVADTPFRPVPKARAMLEALRVAGYRMAVISNTVGEPGRFLARVLERHALARSFDAFAWSDEHPWAKPSRQLFEFALKALRAKAGDAVHIGDGPSDVLGAQAAGYRATILFEGSTEYAPEYRALFAPTGSTPLTPTHRTRRLEEIPGIVERELGSQRAAAGS